MEMGSVRDVLRKSFLADTLLSSINIPYHNLKYR